MIIINLIEVLIALIALGFIFIVIFAILTAWIWVPVLTIYLIKRNKKVNDVDIKKE